MQRKKHDGAQKQAEQYRKQGVVRARMTSSRHVRRLAGRGRAWVCQGVCLNSWSQREGPQP